MDRYLLDLCTTCRIQTPTRAKHRSRQTLAEAHKADKAHATHLNSNSCPCFLRPPALNFLAPLTCQTKLPKENKAPKVSWDVTDCCCSTVAKRLQNPASPSLEKWSRINLKKRALSNPHLGESRECLETAKPERAHLCNRAQSSSRTNRAVSFHALLEPRVTATPVSFLSLNVTMSASKPLPNHLSVHPSIHPSSPRAPGSRLQRKSVKRMRAIVT